MKSIQSYLRLSIIGLIISLVGAIHCLPAKAMDFTFQDPALQSVIWEEIDHTDGIYSFQGTDPAKDDFILGGYAKVDAPIEVVASVLTDIPNFNKWMDMIDKSYVLSRHGDYEVTYYLHSSLPVFLANRDFVINCKGGRGTEAGTLALKCKSVEDKNAPPPSTIRAEIVIGDWKLTPSSDNKTTEVKLAGTSDIKGSVPKWFRNFVQKQWPYRSLRAVRQAVKRPDIVLNPAVLKLMETQPQQAVSTPE